jgi:RNA polymerase sigma-54 factor
VADDGEWGGDAPARRNTLGDDDEVDATELARGNESLQSVPAPAGAVAAPERDDRAALRFLVESLNDDGYLEDSLQALASGLAGDDLEQFRKSWCTTSRWPSACCKAWTRRVWARARWPNA